MYRIFSIKLIVIFLVIIFAGFFIEYNDRDKLTTSSYPVQFSPETNLIPGMTTGANMLTYRYHGGTFSYVKDDTAWIYFVGGDLTGSGTLTQRNERYNVIMDTWRVMAPYPNPPGIWYTAGSTIKDTGYICGGLAEGLANVTGAVRAYNIVSNTWSAKSQLPNPRAMAKVVSYQDSLLYVAGGFDQNGSSLSTVFLYNAITNSWRNATPLPGSRMGGGFARSGDTLVYINGTTGVFNGTVTNTTFVGIISQSDRASITWMTKTPYPGTGRYRQDAQNWGCKGIVISGGASAASYLPAVNECYVYSPGADAWTVQPTLITSRTAHMTGSVKLANNIWKFINVAGYNGANVLTTDILTDTLSGPLGINNNNGQIPADYLLWQNYPNPFNPSTKITYALPKAENVKLVIYDILGKEVLILLNGIKPAGTHIVDFNASELASGVYFYRIEARQVGSLTVEFTDVKKMLLIK